MPKSVKSECSEPDIEDCVSPGATFCIFPHSDEYHQFTASEVCAIREKLVKWFHSHRRNLPWRGDPPPYKTTAAHTANDNTKGSIQSYFQKDPCVNVKLEPIVDEAIVASGSVSPYETWVSEIMLQQTRVDTVIDYFTRWIGRFPTIAQLASASEEEVNSMWAGLGYYRRARMLHAGAKYVMEKYDGELPSSVEALLTIPGIGRYTAGAIASIAFDKKEPLVDGNVIRVMARLRAVGADPKNKKMIDLSWKLAKDLVQSCDSPGNLNQALMELGATICGVQVARCTGCPLKNECLAYARKREDSSLDAHSCTICDLTRHQEWDCKSSNVLHYPLKPRKNASRNEELCIAVLSFVELKEKQQKSSESSDTNKVASTDPILESKLLNWKFLMSKRPKGVLLAGQWEFINMKMGDGTSVPPYKTRQDRIDEELCSTLKWTSHVDNRLKLQRRDLGSLTHVFSHVKHYMGIEHIQFSAKPSFHLDDKNRLRWMTIQDMRSFGITTGVMKILKLVSKSVGKKSSTILKRKRGIP
uniref:Adenine DNA glycosylase n=1 Tax=Albugo laibachii Nc14 TaxID=890382 RepID=F0VZV0_9STRA|nr:predicted protein putative [Albugo laibachii Nc14]|eukprot:CCA14321.1 predicted protein putative [Albugo laibachii Nc14]